MEFVIPVPIVAAFFGALSAVVIVLVKSYLDTKTRAQSLKEDAERALISERLGVYPDLMQNLKGLSFGKWRHTSSTKEEISDEQSLSRSDLVKAVGGINDAIFGKLGLVATHEAREMIIRLRTKIERRLEGDEDISDKDVTLASWKVHQMLRADLGLNQPYLLNALERLHVEDAYVDKKDIERLATDTIKHVDWRGILPDENPKRKSTGYDAAFPPK